ncbi:single-stranded DNA-binding protein [Silvibacterium acidisoli]|uniref:single-stranded DNA-binding protein n=1 Tax=Acidobacteriaceae bacterium ZG23-2 TaxID=2883246 RepID=UPI00406BFCEC
MAKSVNKAILVGNVGRDPDYKMTRGGTAVVEFAICTTERVKEGSGWKDRPEWHNVVALGKLADLIREYVQKGSKLYVEGKLQTRSWEKDGVKRYKTEILVAEFTLLGSRPNADGDPDEEYAGSF